MPKLTNCFAPLRFSEKQRVKKLLEYRIVKDSLLYVIGVPKAYADVDLLRSKNHYGQFGTVQRIVINHNPKKENDSFCRVYESQVAVYLHYASNVEVAMAIKCLNGLRVGGNSNFVLKCSFGTSKYCANFLSNGSCDAYKDGKCPFIHYLERRRHMVIQDDTEFKDFLSIQDSIASEFCEALGLSADFTAEAKEWSLKRGLPGPSQVWGLTQEQILQKAAKNKLISQVKFLNALPDPTNKFYVWPRPVTALSQQSKGKENQKPINPEEPTLESKKAQQLSSPTWADQQAVQTCFESFEQLFREEAGLSKLEKERFNF